MRTLLGGLILASLIAGLAGCSNPQKKVAKAQARTESEKAKILKDYRRCLDKHSSKASKCESYREALDALK